MFGSSRAHQSHAISEMFERLQDLEDVSFTREEADALKADLERLKEQTAARFYRWSKDAGNEDYSKMGSKLQPNFCPAMSISSGPLLKH